MEAQAYSSQSEALLNTALPELIRLVDQTDGWKDLGNNENAQGHMMTSPEGPTVRSVGLINCPAEVIVEFLWDNSRKKSWDEMLIESNKVRELGHKFAIFHEKFKSPWPVSDRDFVVAAKVFERNDGFLMAYKSINAGVPEASGVVRGEVSSCFYVRRVSERVSSLTYIAKIDPKGSIPKAIVNKVASKQALIVAKIRKVVE
jgi:START domain